MLDFKRREKIDTSRVVQFRRGLTQAEWFSLEED
jgi:hypothetical protein